MSIKDELIYDFGFNYPRVLVCGRMCVLDNVKKIAMITDNQVVVHNGKQFTAVFGGELLIKELDDERMLISGEIERIEFY